MLIIRIDTRGAIGESCQRCARHALAAPRPYNRAMASDLEKRFGFLIADVGRLYGKRYDDLAKSSLELTRAQCRMIAYLAHYGDMNQASHSSNPLRTGMMAPPRMICGIKT